MFYNGKRISDVVDLMPVFGKGLFDVGVIAH